jgi:hypothetical protein
MIEISDATAAFLLSVLDGITLRAGAPDFAQTAQSVIEARRELTRP